MVTSQNGERHSNGHVLVENQQTRLPESGPDSEVHEATSKSKFIADILCLFVFRPAYYIHYL